MSVKERLFQKKNWWHLIAISVFLIVSFSYFSPALSGYTIKQGDVQNWAGGAQEIMDYREITGEETQWTNSMFSGMPSVQISMRHPGLGILDFIKDAFTLWLPRPINFLFLYFIGFYVLGLSLKVKPYISILGAVIYGLSSYFIIILEAGHNTKALAIGFAPMVLAGFIWAYRAKKIFLPLVLSGLFMALELRVNHVQITYYLGILLVGIGILELIKAVKSGQLSSFVKRTFGIGVMYLLAIGINYGNIKGTLDYTKHSTRGSSELTINADGTEKSAPTKGLEVDYITNWSYGIGETFTFIVPNFKGGATQAIGGNESNKSILKDVDRNYRQNIAGRNQYWGEQPFTSGPVYIGVIVVFLAVLALYYLDDKLKWVFLVVTILTVMLSWGKNFLGLTEFFVDYVPGYGKFRAVTIILSIAALILPILAILFLNKLLKERDKIANNIQPFFIISGVFAALLLAFYGMPTTFNNFIAEGELAQLNAVDPNSDQYNFAIGLFDELEQVRISIFRKDVLRSFGFLAIAIAAVFIALKNESFAKKGLVPILAVFVFADLLSVDTRYLSNDTSGNDAQWVKVWKQQYPYTANAGDRFILNEELKNPSVAESVNDQVKETKKTLKENRIKGGEAQKKTEHDKYRALNRATHFRVYEQGNAFNSARASYFHKSIGGYHGAKMGKYQELIEFQIAKNNQAVMDMLNVKYVLSPNGQQAVPNPSTLGNAWFVKQVKTVETANDWILSLNTKNSFELETHDGFKVSVNGKLDSIVEVKGTEELVLIGPNQETIPLTDVPFQASTQQDIALYNSENGVNWGYANALVPDRLITMRNKPSGFNPSNEAVVRKDDQSKLSSDEYSAEGTIVLDKYYPNKLIYTSSTSEDQLAIFSEIYIGEGWKATIDGEEAEILPANYVLRALEIPAGEHKIEFTYALDSYARGNTISLILTVLLVLLLGGAIYWDYIRTESA